MKKVFTLALSLLFAATLSAQKYGGPAAVNTSTTEYERASTLSEVSLSIEYPIDGDDAYLKAFEKYVLGDVASMARLDTISELPAMSVQSADQAAKAVGLFFADQVKKVITESMEDSESEEGNFLTPWSYKAEVRKVFSNHLYVTFTVESYLYTGGAHGMPYKGYYTIDRITGQRYECTDLFPASVNAKLASIVRRNMLASGEYDKDMFFEPNYGLPSNKAVGLSDKGITFIYGPYEIAAGAVGMPETVVPWSQVYSIMTAKGKALSTYKPAATTTQRTTTRR